MLQINLTGNETPEQLMRVGRAINAYCEPVSMADKVIKAAGFKVSCKGPGEPLRAEFTVPHAEDLIPVEEGGNAVQRAPVSGENPFAEDSGMSTTDDPVTAENCAHSYTEGMTTSTPVGTSDSFIRKEFMGCDPVTIFNEDAPLVPAQNYDCPPSGLVELDAAGKPWDEKLHSSSREKTKDGCWKFKRGLDPALRSAAENAVAPLQGLPTPPAVSIPPAPVARVVTDTPMETAQAIVQTAPPPPPATEAHTLPWLMQQCHKFAKSKADIDAALAACGLKTIPDLLAQLDKMDAVAAALGVL